MDNNPQAARDFYSRVRKLCAGATVVTEGVVFHQVTPDEAYDLSLVSERVYGRRDEYLAVMAAAGIDTPETPLAQAVIALPTPASLLELKRASGFESIAEFRDSGSPTWINQ